MKISLGDYDISVKENGAFRYIKPLEHSTIEFSCGGPIKHEFAYIDKGIYTKKTFDNADVRFSER